MKFVSKNSNLRVVLKPGIPGDRLTGRIAEAGVYVKFEDGIAEVKDETLVKLMLDHPGFESDFIKMDEGDPYKYNRAASEPEHNIVDLEFGHVGKNRNPKSAVVFTPEQLKALDSLINAKANEKAIDMLKGLAAQAANTDKIEETETPKVSVPKTSAPQTKSKANTADAIKVPGPNKD